MTPAYPARTTGYPRPTGAGLTLEDPRCRTASQHVTQFIHQAIGRPGSSQRIDRLRLLPRTAPPHGPIHKGQTLGVSGTPTILLDDGCLLPGYVPPHDLARLLNQPAD